jgi:hypothetical protein
MSDKDQLYSELASFTGGNPQDFVASNLAAEKQWIADLHLKLQVSNLKTHLSAAAFDTVVAVLAIAGSHRSVSPPCLCRQEIIHHLCRHNGVHATRPPSSAHSTSGKTQSHCVSPRPICLAVAHC